MIWPALTRSPAIGKTKFRDKKETSVALGSLLPLSLLGQCAAPEFFHESAFFQIIDKAVIENLIRLAPNHRAVCTGKLEGIADHFCRYSHAPIDEISRVGVVRRTKRIGISNPQRPADRIHRKLRIFFDEINGFCQSSHRFLHDFRPLSQAPRVGEQGAVNEGKAKIVQSVNDIKAVLPAARIEWRLDQRRLKNILGQRRVAFRRGATYRGQRDFFLCKTKLLEKLLGQTISEISGSSDAYAFAFQI